MGRQWALFSIFVATAQGLLASEHNRRLPHCKSRRLKAQATPIDPSGWPERFPAKEHCSKCGLCETSFVSKVTDACAFLGEGMARMDRMEENLHGRKRILTEMGWSSSEKSGAEEARFGVLYRPVALAKGAVTDSQWTGCVTGIALAALETDLVDAVVCISANEAGQWPAPEPIVAKTKNMVLKGRGVKPALAPSLRVLDEIKEDPTIKRLLFCGVGCAVQAFRAVQDDLGLDGVYVLGTNCADNSPTPAAARNFLKSGLKVDGNIEGYEFAQDFRVHAKQRDSYLKIPYFSLPGSIAESSIAPSCLACFDYTNGLADVVVGYMGAPLGRNSRMDESFQTLTVRNERGARMVKRALETALITLGGEARGQGKHESLASATVGSDSIVMKMTDKQVPESGMPRWMGEIMALIMTTMGPKGTNFARYSIDYHILRNYLHVLDVWGEDRARTSLPSYAREIVDHYLKTDETIASLSKDILAKRSKQTAP